MSARPRIVTIISWIFIAVGCVGIVAGGRPLIAAAVSGRGAQLASREIIDAGWAGGSGVLAMLGGVFLLRGANWARWLLVAWMGFHVGLSLFHSAFELVVHGVLFSGIAYLLYRPRASAYFAGRRTEPPSVQPPRFVP